jgi:hypothetical protein
VLGVCRAGAGIAARMTETVGTGGGMATGHPGGMTATIQGTGGKGTGHPGEMTATNRTGHPGEMIAMSGSATTQGGKPAMHGICGTIGTAGGRGVTAGRKGSGALAKSGGAGIGVTGTIERSQGRQRCAAHVWSC